MPQKYFNLLIAASDELRVVIDAHVRQVGHTIVVGWPSSDCDDAVYTHNQCLAQHDDGAKREVVRTTTYVVGERRRRRRRQRLPTLTALMFHRGVVTPNTTTQRCELS